MTTRTTLILALAALTTFTAIFLPPRIRITTNIPKTVVCMINY